MNEDAEFFPEELDGVDPDKIDVTQLAMMWIEARGEYSRPWVVLQELVRFAPVKAFEAIVAIDEALLASPPTELKLRGLLAAGPLEDLLGEHGEAVFGLIEARANREPEFRKLLSGVWKNAMSDELYARIQKLQDPTFRFE